MELLVPALLGFAVSVLSGLLGIGGGIVMAPALLYLPHWLGMPALSMSAVTGLTITQGLFSSASAVARHHRSRAVDRRLVGWMGGALLVCALAGSVASKWISGGTLIVVFAGLAATGALLMLTPRANVADPPDSAGGPLDFSVPLAVAIGAVVGFLAGMVGQGGSFILIPLMLVVLRIPTRAAIGSNLAIVLMSSLAGFAGKLGTGQVPLLPALGIVAGAVAGATIGSALSQRTHPRWLRRGLAAVVGLMAIGISGDAIGLF